MFLELDSERDGLNKSILLHYRMDDTQFPMKFDREVSGIMSTRLITATLYTFIITLSLSHKHIFNM